ncbi:MAG TPA: phosphate ABC transporter substrate-binding protein PstS [Candidatus Kapabacteria bacterium]|nr:phosphate ABC transporter substrate-binding protein PstS [Candidatus Kapabacteria bacterium]
MKTKILVHAALMFGAFTLNASAQLKLNGAGATFPYVIYTKWFDEYHKKTGIEFNYQSIGSGGGIKQIIAGTVDFGATDAPMTDEQLKQAKQNRGTNILHIPTVMGAVVITYNVKGVGKDLKLTPDVLADIYLGKITKWNDPRLKKLNPGMNLPNEAIFVVHRSDGSGTSNIFTSYLTKVSPTWAKQVGQGTSVKWPVGLGGKGNEGVSGIVKQTEGSIGYVELAYAEQNGLSYASIKNKAGNFVSPTFDAVSNAAAGFIKNIPSDLRVDITNADGKNSYPISSFTWILVYQNMNDKTKAKAIADFLKWALTDGQQYAKGLYYAPLPKEVVELAKKKVAEIQVK